MDEQSRKVIPLTGAQRHHVMVLANNSQIARAELQAAQKVYDAAQKTLSEFLGYCVAEAGVTGSFSLSADGTALVESTATD